MGKDGRIFRILERYGVTFFATKSFEGVFNLPQVATVTTCLGQ